MKKTIHLFCAVICLAALILTLVACVTQSSAAPMELPAQSEATPENDPIAVQTDPTPEPVTPEPTDTPEPKKVTVLDRIVIYWLGSTYTYKVGEDIELDDFGQIVRFEDKYDVLTMEYDDDHHLTKVFITSKKNGSVGYQEWELEDGYPVSGKNDPNDGFHYMHSYVFRSQVEEGKLVELVENDTMVDPKTRETDRRITDVKYEYNGSGIPSSLVYMIDGKTDHFSLFTYDGDDNLTVYSSIDPEDGSEYLRFELSYRTVYDDSLNRVEDAFTRFDNFDKLINHIL